jgi:hypothetical protein
MAQAALQSNPGRMRRKHPEVQRLDGVTWFGDLVIRLTTALREVSAEGLLKLLEPGCSQSERHHCLGKAPAPKITRPPTRAASVGELRCRSRGG